MTKENNEILENENKNENENKLSKDELLNLLAEDFFSFYKKNKNNFSSSTSILIIFSNFLENIKENSLIKKIEEELGRELSFDDIKELYLNSYHTLEDMVILEEFKKFKNKEIVKSIIKKFQDKFNEKGININIEKVLPEEIKNDENLEKIFNEIRKILKEENKENLEKIKSIKVTNKEIIEQAIQDGIIKDEEKNIIEEESKKSINTFSNEMKNILEVLLSSSLLNSFNEIKDSFEKSITDFEKINTPPKLSNIIEDFKNKNPLNLSNEEKESIWEEIIKNDKENKIIEEVKECNTPDEITKNICVEKIKEKYIEKYFNDNLKYLDYLAKKGNNKAKILLKLLRKEDLNSNDESILYNDFKDIFIDNNLEILSRIYNLNEEEKNIYKEYLENILDENKDTINIGGLDFNLDKNIEFKKNNEDIFDSYFDINLSLKGDNISKLSHIFPNYFTNINGKEYSIFTKYKIKLKNGEEITGYINENGNGEIEVYENYENALKGEEMIKKNNKEDIENIEKQEEEKIILCNDKFLKIIKLGLNNIERLKKEQYYNNIVLKELKNNSLNSNSKEKEKNIEEFKKEWKENIEGDKNAEFKEGTIISLKGNTINLHGIKNNWFHCEISEINEDEGYFKLKIIDGILEGEGDKEFKAQIDLRIISNMKIKSFGNVMKFKKINNAEEFGDYINNLELKSDHLGFEKTLQLWKNSGISIKNGKIYKKNYEGKDIEITKIGKLVDKSINTNESAENIIKGKKSIEDSFFVYNINVSGNKVILTHPYDKSYNKAIDFNTFLNIILHNGFEPWHEEEFKTIEKDYTKKSAKKQSPIKFFAIIDFVSSFKELKKNFLYHFKEDDELRAAEMYEKLAGLMPSVWFFRDIKLEASNEKESKIWKRIQNAKSFLDMKGDDKGGVHAKRAADLINKEIFEKVKKGNSLSRREELKAAGYLLYALERGPGAYFRGLKKYEGSGMWIKALLGESHWRKWKNRNQTLIEQIKKDPTNQQLRDTLVKSELFYIKDTPETGNIYSNDFVTNIEGLAIQVTGDSGKANNTYETEASKGSFNLIYDGLKSYIVNNRIPNSIGALKAISERIEDENNYVDYYKVILMFILSGHAYNNFGTPYREEFGKICRTYGVPLGMFAFDYYGINKILKIMDYIVKIKQGNNAKSFTEHVFGVKDPDSISITDLNGTKKTEIIGKLEKFWKNYGDEIVEVLDYSDFSLIKYNKKDLEDQKNKEKIEVNESTKKAIGEYFSYVNYEGYGESWEYGKDLGKSSYAPYYQRGVFNLGNTTFSKIALNIEEGDFKGDKGMAKGMWLGVQSRLKLFQNIAKDDDIIYEFILKKYLLWFGRSYKSPCNNSIEVKCKLYLIKALLEQDKNAIEKLIVELNKKRLGGHYGLPPEIMEGLKEFSKTLYVGELSEKHKEKILNLLSKEERKKLDEIKNEELENAIDKTYLINTHNEDNLRDLKNMNKRLEEENKHYEKIINSKRLESKENKYNNDKTSDFIDYFMEKINKGDIDISNINDEEELGAIIGKYIKKFKDTYPKNKEPYIDFEVAYKKLKDHFKI